MHKTSAWPLSLLYAALIVYASLYPFADWRDQGIEPWAYLWQPFPKYWTGFDVAINVLGYAPFGFLLALSALRTGRSRHAVVVASVTGSAMAFLMEGFQSYLPSRVPSNVDFLLNAAGICTGAGLAALLEKAGALARWNRIRERWFVSDARGGLVLLALWPVALLFPSVVPLGLGQVMERLEAALADSPMPSVFGQPKSKPAQVGIPLKKWHKQNYLVVLELIGLVSLQMRLLRVIKPFGFSLSVWVLCIWSWLHNMKVSFCHYR